jgi:putative oxidoreductase
LFIDEDFPRERKERKMWGRRDDGWEKARDWGYLVLRVALAVIFIAHGGQKLFGWFGGHGLAVTVAFFGEKLGIPAPLAMLAILTEFFGGLAVLLGVFTRTAGLGLAVNMAVAALKVHLANGFFLNWENVPGRGHGIEDNLALGAMALFLLLAGPGRWALGGDTERRLVDGWRRPARITPADADGVERPAAA